MCSIVLALGTCKGLVEGEMKVTDFYSVLRVVQARAGRKQL